MLAELHLNRFIYVNNHAITATNISNNQFLNREIQQHEDGHDSKEDALAALDLIKQLLEKKQMLEMKYFQYVDDDNNFGFDAKFGACGGIDAKDDEDEEDGNFSEMYDDACMLMKYGDVDDQYDYFLGDYWRQNQVWQKAQRISKEEETNWEDLNK